jgi:putative ABC transport system substrate-binding protein
VISRRVFLHAVAGGVLAPRAAEAQQRSKVPRIGYMGLVSAASHASRVEAFRTGLRDLGYIEGKTILIDFRWAEGFYDRLPALAAELVRLNVDVIVTHGSAGALAAKQATATIPIVITAVADILALGLVSSLARPGGNVTGLTFFNPDVAAKRLELLKESVPSVSRAAILLNPDNPSNLLILQGLKMTAKALKVQLQRFEAKAPSDFNRAFAAMAHQRIGAVMIHENDADCERQGDCRSCRPAAVASVRISGIRGRRWPDGLRSELPRHGSPRGYVRRQDSQRRETQ